MQNQGSNFGTGSKFRTLEPVPGTGSAISGYFFGLMSRAGIEQARSTFWSVTQSLLFGYQATIPPLEGDT